MAARRMLETRQGPTGWYVKLGDVDDDLAFILGSFYLREEHARQALIDYLTECVQELDTLPHGPLFEPDPVLPYGGAPGEIVEEKPEDD